MSFVVSLVDHVAAGFGVLRFDEALTGREHAASDMVARLDNRHFGAPRCQIAGRTQTGEAATSDQHGNPGEISRHAGSV
jgi:hypothetical protein